MTNTQIERTYLDHAATSPLRPEARAAMIETMDVVGNPAAQHGSGRRASGVLEDARERVAAALGAHPLEVVFTSGGTEADALAVLGGVRARRDTRPRSLVGATEHPAVALTAAEQLGPTPESEVIPVDEDGRADLEALAGLMSSRSGAVGLVSVQTVNNETGVVQPVAQIAAMTHAAGAWFHTDAVQAVGHVPIDFAPGETAPDLLSVSAHKVGGPIGIGALLVRRGVTLSPWGPGGRQEGGVRSGTQAPVLAVGFAAALEAACADQQREAARLGALRQRIVDEVPLTVPGSFVNGVECSPSIVNITVDGVRASDVLLLLDRAGIDASAGSACRAGVQRPSDVLLAMGRSEAEASGSLRFSMGWSTTDADIERLLTVLPGAVEQARQALDAGLMSGPAIGL